MSKLQNIQTISLENLIKQSITDAEFTIEADSEKCEGCSSLVLDECGSGQALIECAGGEDSSNPDHCLQLKDVIDNATKEYQDIKDNMEGEI